MARSATRDNFHAYAEEHVIPQVFSSVFKFTTLAPALGMKGATDGALGRKGSAALIGRKLDEAKKQTLSGSTQAQIFFQTGKVGGTKHIGVDDVASSAGAERSNRKKKSIYVSWTEIETPIALENQVLDANQGPAKIGSAISDATRMAVEEHLEVLADELYTGSPSSHSDEISSECIGLQQWIHDSNNIGGIDRSSSANQYFRGRRSTASLALSLKLIDDIVLTGVDDGSAGTTIPLLRHSSLADLVVTTETNYNKLKQEALSRGVGRLVSGNELPKGAGVGFLGEFIDYNGKLIVPDPYCPASHLFVLDSSTFLIQFMAGKNFTPQKFVNLRELQPGTGAPDLTTSALVSKYRMLCFEPWKSFQGTTVA